MRYFFSFSVNKKWYAMLLQVASLFGFVKLEAQNNFGNDSQRVHSFVASYYLASLDLFRDSSFIFSYCDSGCICIKGTWRSAGDKIILGPGKNYYPCGKQDFIRPGWQYTISADTLILTKDKKGLIKGGTFQGSTFYWFYVPVVRKLRRSLSVSRDRMQTRDPMWLELKNGKWIETDKWEIAYAPAREYIAKKYNVQIKRTGGLRTYFNAKWIGRKRLEAIRLEYVRAFNGYTRDRYYRTKQICNCYTY